MRNIRIFKNSRELFEKLKDDRSKFKENVEAYDFFNFVITGYHLKEWIENENPKLSQAAQDDLRLRVVRAIRKRGLSQAEAVRTFGVSKSSVIRWMKISSVQRGPECIRFGSWKM